MTNRKRFKFAPKLNYFEKKQQEASNESKKEINDEHVEISANIKENVSNISDILGSPIDLVIRNIILQNSTKCTIVCMDGLVDSVLIHQHIIKPLLNTKIDSNKDLLKTLEEDVITSSELKIIKEFKDMINSVLAGEAAIFLEGKKECILIDAKGWQERSVEEPVTDAVIRGPRDGFTENIATNISLLRRKVNDTMLRFDDYTVGVRSNKKLVITYMNDVVHPQLLKEVKERIQSIEIDHVPESGYIEELIEDSILSPFPQIESTERPDKVAAAIIQGKVAIFLDGTPFALMMPMTFADVFQSPSDYYERWIIASVIRFIRFIALFIAIFLPALYIALVTYHPGMLPSKLAFSIASARSGVPIPAFIEAFLMEITMELIREASERLPKPIGQTIGIVGGLVIGEAAVRAGIVSPIMVIVVSVTAISTFISPSYSTGYAFRIIRFLLMLAASVLGLFGVILAYIALNVHVANLKSFGIPYTTPFAPAIFQDWKDLVFRAPLTVMQKRPKFLQTEDTERLEKR